MIQTAFRKHLLIKYTEQYHIALCSALYNYNALYGVVHEICSTARSFDLRCESVTSPALYHVITCSVGGNNIANPRGTTVYNIW